MGKQLKRMAELMKAVGMADAEISLEKALSIDLGDLDISPFIKTEGEADAMRSLLYETDARDLPGFLTWMADRLVNKYGEPEGIDFVNSLRTRATDLSAAIKLAKDSQAK